MPFIKRKIDLKFTLAKGKWGESGFDTITISGLRVLANIIKTGGLSMGGAQITVFGMTPRQMARLTRVNGYPTEIGNNTVEVLAGDDDSGMTTVFIGTIFEAAADFGAMPSVAFVVRATPALWHAMKPVGPSSYKGRVDVAVIMKNLATTMGLTFENGGVEGVILSNPYLPGTAYEQFRTARDDAGIEGMIDRNVLAIWPRGGSRGSKIPTVSKDTGMIGYPRFSANGIEFAHIYSPSIDIGTTLQVESDWQSLVKAGSDDPLLKNMSGKWTVSALTHVLEAEMPNGSWAMFMTANAPGFAPLKG